MKHQISARFLARIQREGEWGDDVEIEARAHASKSAGKRAAMRFLRVEGCVCDMVRYDA